MATTFKHAVVVGASSGIGAALVRALAADGCKVAAVARRGDLLAALAADLQARTGQDHVVPIVHDVVNHAEAAGLLQRAAAALGGLDLVVYAAGVMPPLGEDEYDVAQEKRMVDVNVTGAMAWLGPAAERFARTGGGTLVGISSIAGDRGRRGNPVYCATKAALNTYLEGLRNRTARNGVRVVTIKPGFVDTDMTRGKPGLFWLIGADEAARQILAKAARGCTTAYVPARWALVGFIIRHIPSFVFRRLGPP
jgi:NADP-dependent 3-hydroxy acid dehydrogenase YdfG